MEDGMSEQEKALSGKEGSKQGNDLSTLNVRDQHQKCNSCPTPAPTIEKPNAPPVEPLVNNSVEKPIGGNGDNPYDDGEETPEADSNWKEGLSAEWIHD